MNEIERFLAKSFDRQYCLFTSRGATAIYLALVAVKKLIGSGEVILPSISCTTPAISTYLAGFTPVFADVNRNDACLQLSSVLKKAGPDTKAIIPIHIYGHSVNIDDMNKIIEVVNNKGIFVIEDAAQAIGAYYKNGKKVGSLGHFSILSFGKSKIIDTGYGGALLCDNKDIYQLIRLEANKLKSFKTSLLCGLGESFRNIYQGIVQLKRFQNDFRPAQFFKRLVDRYSKIYLNRVNFSKINHEFIKKQIFKLPHITEQRRRKAFLYRKFLVHPEIKHLEIKETDTIWRYSILISNPSNLYDITNGLRNAGFHASNLYWNVDDFFYGSDDLVNAKYISKRILNLWVDESVDESYIKESSKTILKILNRGKDG